LRVQRAPTSTGRQPVIADPFPSEIPAGPAPRALRRRDTLLRRQPAESAGRSITVGLRSPRSPSGRIRPDHDPAIADISLHREGAPARLFSAAMYTSCKRWKTPEIVQVFPRSSNAKKALQGRQFHYASCSFVVISDRDRGISASQKASLDKCAPMRPKIAPMFTICREPFRHPFLERLGAPRNPVNPHRNPKHRGCRSAARHQLRIHGIFVIFCISRDRRFISVTAFDSSKKMPSSEVIVSEPKHCVEEPLGEPEMPSCVTPSAERG
jgi:hypothetical protein